MKRRDWLKMLAAALLVPLGIWRRKSLPAGRTGSFPVRGRVLDDFGVVRTTRPNERITVIRSDDPADFRVNDWITGSTT